MPIGPLVHSITYDLLPFNEDNQQTCSDDGTRYCPSSRFQGGSQSTKTTVNVFKVKSCCPLPTQTHSLSLSLSPQILSTLLSPSAAVCVQARSAPRSRHCLAWPAVQSHSRESLHYQTMETEENFPVNGPTTPSDL